MSSPGNERLRVLVSTDLPGPALARLRLAHDVDIGEHPTGLGRERILARVARCAGLVTLLSDRVDRAVLAAAPSLQVVANCAVGVDNVDLDACRERGVVVTNTPDVLTDATADLTLGLVLAACRRIAEGDRLLRRGGWRGWSPTELLGVRVTGAALGIVGFGRIGKAVARRALGFGMRIAYSQRHQAPAQVERELAARHLDLDALLATSDVVCISCPLTDETRGMISAERIGRMKPGAVLVNTARGPIVDEEALAVALERGHLSAAGLDVFEREPQIAARLLRSERAVIAPHIASADAPTREEMARLCVDAVLDVLAGRMPPNRVT